MKNILCLPVILLLIFSCGHAENGGNRKKVKQEILKTQPFIPELDEKLVEISGLLVYDDLFWGFNDSGGKNKIYGFNQNGKIKKVVEIENAKNVDWESITQDEKNIYIGDFGNNKGKRDNLCIYKIKKKDIKDKKEQKLEAEKIKFSYALQTNFIYIDRTTPFDCEAMVEFKGDLFLFSKNWQDHTSTVYKIPTKAGEYKLEPLDTFNVKGLITGADISHDNKKLALVGYQNYQSFIWLFSNFSDHQFYKGNSQLFQLENTTNAQTEGICFYSTDTLLVSCEKTNSFYQQVFMFDITKLTNETH
uniref:hypothetical protein n=1 Tax=uncultured Draconibacterium sp. TaxID=1573823 RepID=UPI0032171471